MIIFVIAATTEGVIGNKNKMPWHIKEELQLFKKITTGKTILMGRKTFESLKCTPLPNRKNIILTRKKEYTDRKDIIVEHNFNFILKKYHNIDSKNNLYVIGGAEIYKLFSQHCSEIYLSIIKNNYPGNTKIKLQQILSNYELIYEKDHEEFIETKYIKVVDLF